MSPTVVTILTILSIFISVALLFLIAKSRQFGASSKQSKMVGIIAILVIIGGISFGLSTKSTPSSFEDILLVNSVILVSYLAILATAGYVNHRRQSPSKLSTRKIAFLGIIIGLASALMLLGFPVIPGFVFLKVELSGLIIFMTLLWFDFKTAVIVSLFTNFIHVFMPGSPPLIIFLDEGVNFIATMVFLTPMAVMINRKKLAENTTIKQMALISFLGVIFTTVVMTLYNAFINLPIIYGWPLPFNQVVEIFGLFNLIKWGLVALVINLTWKRLYTLRNYGEEDYCEL
jgi:riboflavin transporter